MLVESGNDIRPQCAYGKFGRIIQFDSISIHVDQRKLYQIAFLEISLLTVCVTWCIIMSENVKG
jgi:hypothetical protein